MISYHHTCAVIILRRRQRREGGAPFFAEEEVYYAEIRSGDHSLFGKASLSVEQARRAPRT